MQQLRDVQMEIRLRERRITDPGTLLDGARRAMRASFQREMDVVESSLSFLATDGGALVVESGDVSSWAEALRGAIAEAGYEVVSR